MYRRNYFVILMLILGMLLFTLPTNILHAQTIPDLTWFSVDVGGAVSSAGDYTLRGVAGQADAGQLSAGGYTLTGGVLAVAPQSTPPDQSPGATLFIPKLSR